MPSNSHQSADQQDTVGEQDLEKKTGRLEAEALKIAASHQNVSPTQASIEPTARLRQLEDWLDEARQRFAADASESTILSVAAEWMLDNYYIVEQALLQVKRNLPDTYYEQLPKITDASVEVGDISMRGYPRVYAMGHAYLIFEAYTLQPERLERFVKAYQKVTPLTMGELWALPIMLRLALLENLVRSAGRVVKLFDKPPIPIPAANATSDEEIVAHAIPSLHATENFDWKEFFEDVSLVHQELCDDPTRMYGKMDFDTRDRLS